MDLSKIPFISFTPVFQYRIWGGEKLRTKLHKAYSGSNIGESWEISSVEGSVSPLETPIDGCQNLQQLIDKFPEEILGRRVYKKFGKNFPLLIKFIDAAQPLSVQVHPDDDFAKTNHNSFGKTEMWYIIEAEDNAEIISGFSEKLSIEQYRNAVTTGKTENILKTWKVNKDDVIFLPAGRVHAIGAGILLAEIQQSADVTYRIYDFNRVDKDGKPRELHNDMAERVINFLDTETPFIFPEKIDEISERLVQCKYFITNLIIVETPIKRIYASLDSFIIYMCAEGAVELKSGGEIFRLNAGQTVLIPACNKEIIEILPQERSKILEVYIPE